MLETQMLNYDFEYHSAEFDANMRVLVLSEGPRCISIVIYFLRLAHLRARTYYVSLRMSFYV